MDVVADAVYESYQDYDGPVNGLGYRALLERGVDVTFDYEITDHERFKAVKVAMTRFISEQF